MSLTISRSIDITNKRIIGRNDLCYCGSDKKYKKCHLRQDQGYSQDEKGSYISRLIDWVTHKKWFQDKLTEQLHAVYGKNPRIEENQLAIVTEALVYEWQYQGKTPLQHFVERAGLTLSERTFYQNWINQSVFSLFIVEEIKIGVSILIFDTINSIKYLVFEKSGSYSLQSGMLIVGRIVPFQDHWMFTGADVNVFPKEMVYVFEREKKLGRLTRIGELEYIDIFYKKNNKTSLHKHSIIQKLNEEPGQIEQILVKQMMQEAQIQIQNLTPEIANKKLKTFSEVWFDTPQDELNGKTPRIIILEERIKLGNSHKEIKYSVTVSAVPSSEISDYNNAVNLMKDEKDYLKALIIFSKYDPNKLPESFRWFNNVGICLIRLGEMDLAKNYFNKAIELKSDYDVPKDNLRNYDDLITIREMEEWGQQELFQEIIQEKNNNFSHELQIFIAQILKHTKTDQRKLFILTLHIYKSKKIIIPLWFGKQIFSTLEENGIIVVKDKKYCYLTKYGITVMKEILSIMQEEIPKNIRSLI